MRTPEELEEPDGLACPLRFPWGTLVLLAGRSPYLSLCWSMARAEHISARLDWCRIRPPGPGLPQPQPWSLAALWRRSHSHGPELGAVYQHCLFSTPRSPSEDLLYLNIWYRQMLKTYKKQMTRENDKLSETCGILNCNLKHNNRWFPQTAFRICKKKPFLHQSSAV